MLIVIAYSGNGSSNSGGDSGNGHSNVAARATAIMLAVVQRARLCVGAVEARVGAGVKSSASELASGASVRSCVGAAAAFSSTCC